MYPHAQQVIVLAQLREVPFRSVPHPAEVADRDHQRSGPDYPERASDRIVESVAVRRRTRPASDSAERSKQPERPAPPAPDTGLGRKAPGEHETADTVAVVGRRPCEQRGGLGRHDRLERLPGAEPHVNTEVDDEEDGSVALLVEELRVRATGAGGHPPVDASDVVAGEVDSRFRVLHSPASQPGDSNPGTTATAGDAGVQRQARGPRTKADEVRSGERYSRQATDAPGRAPGVEPARSGSPDHGTATLESSASTTWSASMPSASASKPSSTRWRSTSGAMAWMSWGAT